MFAVFFLVALIVAYMAYMAYVAFAGFPKRIKCGQGKTVSRFRKLARVDRLPVKRSVNSRRELRSENRVEAVTGWTNRSIPSRHQAISRRLVGRWLRNG